MGELTRNDILQVVEEKKIKFIYLQFSDILGTVKNVTIPVQQLPKALDGEIAFDGSSIEGFVRIEESDMLLKPDPNTLTVFPWKTGEGATARMICDVYDIDGEPFQGCPRHVLKKALKEAEEMGYTANAGPECEFFLFLKNEKGEATTISHDRGGYFDLQPLDLGENARHDMVLYLQEMGFEVETSHHEVAPGQHEISFQYANALLTADNVATFKFVVRTVALQHNLHATFMPKPIQGINGSGMHTHLSLFNLSGENAFYSSLDERGLSPTAYHFIGGLMKHVRGYTAITNPLINSYKRLVPGHEAPIYIAWSEQNRSPLIRVPSRKGKGTRVELRSPDPSCNPYLAFAVMLKAGLNGVKNKIEPPPPVNSNIYNLSKEEQQNEGINELPLTMEEAVEELEKDEIIKEALGEHIFQRFIDAKKMECENFRSHVHPWELEQYLRVF